MMNVNTQIRIPEETNTTLRRMLLLLPAAAQQDDVFVPLLAAQQPINTPVNNNNNNDEEDVEQAQYDEWLVEHHNGIGILSCPSWLNGEYTTTYTATAKVTLTSIEISYVADDNTTILATKIHEFAPLILMAGDRLDIKVIVDGLNIWLS